MSFPLFSDAPLLRPTFINSQLFPKAVAWGSGFNPELEDKELGTTEAVERPILVLGSLVTSRGHYKVTSCSFSWRMSSYRRDVFSAFVRRLTLGWSFGGFLLLLLFIVWLV